MTHELAHELDLARFAPLAPIQAFHLLVAVHDGVSNPAALAARVTIRCPEYPPLAAADVGALANVARTAITSPLDKYSLWAQAFPDPWLAFMNYGYLASPPAPPHPPALAGAAVVWPLAAAMYQRVAGAVDLSGADVLEVGCGRGGGAAYVARHLGPRAVVASDGCASNVMAARAAHALERLTFEHARAEALPFPDSAFDAVINIESCKYYRPLAAFVAGVHRLLRPGGKLLSAYFAEPPLLTAIRDAIVRGGFAVVDEEDMSVRVCAAIAQTRGNLPAIIAAQSTIHAPHHYVELLDGAYTIPALTTGKALYYRFVLARI